MKPSFERPSDASQGTSATFDTGYHLSTRELLGGPQVSFTSLAGLPPAMLAELARLRRAHAVTTPRGAPPRTAPRAA